MKRNMFLLTCTCLVLLTAQAAAQTTAPSTPKVIMIVREDIKTGMMEAHSREANGTVRIWAKAKSPYHRLAMVPVAGNENEVTYIWPFDSFASLEKSQQELDKIGATFKADFDRTRHEGEDYHVSQRDSIAVLREDLSYRPAADIPHMRFLRMETIRVRPGHEAEFVEARKIIKTAHEKANQDEHFAIFEIVGGAPTGTYLVFSPWKSLGVMDTEIHGKAYQDALGDENRKKLAKIRNDALGVTDIVIYAFNPQLSYIPQEFVAADPGFWTLKTMEVAAAKPVSTKKAAAKAAPKKQ